jgi:hypothetical protein
MAWSPINKLSIHAHTEQAVPLRRFMIPPVGTSRTSLPSEYNILSPPLSSIHPNPNSQSQQSSRYRRSRSPTSEEQVDAPPTSRPRTERFDANQYKEDVLSRIRSIYEEYRPGTTGPNVHLKSELGRFYGVPGKTLERQLIAG